MPKQNKILKSKTQTTAKKIAPEKPKIIWFKLGKYPYICYPATWQGWSVIIAYLIFNITNYFLIKSQTKSASDLLINFIFDILLSTLLFVLVVISKAEKGDTKLDQNK